MSRMKPDPSVATLIGDVVRSRAAADRPALHDAARGAARDGERRAASPSYRCGSRWATSSRAASTRVGEALHAALWLRLHLAPQAELRHGVGWGSVAVLADEPARRGRTRAGGRLGRPSSRSSWRRSGRPPAGCARPTAAPSDTDGPDPGRRQRGADVSGPDDWLCLGSGRCGCCVARSPAGPRPSWPRTRASLPRRSRSGCATTGWP